ncbi:Unannotated, partial [Lentimonas sp. CC8]
HAAREYNFGCTAAWRLFSAKQLGD